MRVVVLWLVPLWLLAFVVRVIAVAALRGRRPGAAAAIERWWPWTPLLVLLPVLVVVLVVLIWNVPVVGIPAALVAALITYNVFFSSSSIGSPFRPRR